MSKFEVHGREVRGESVGKVRVSRDSEPFRSTEVEKGLSRPTWKGTDGK